jgi:hypothetical protein
MTDSVQDVPVTNIGALSVVFSLSEVFRSSSSNMRGCCVRLGEPVKFMRMKLMAMVMIDDKRSLHLN